MSLSTPGCSASAAIRSRAVPPSQQSGSASGDIDAFLQQAHRAAASIRCAVNWEEEEANAEAEDEHGEQWLQVRGREGWVVRRAEACLRQQPYRPARGLSFGRPRYAVESRFHDFSLNAESSRRSLEASRRAKKPPKPSLIDKLFNDLQPLMQHYKGTATAGTPVSVAHAILQYERTESVAQTVESVAHVPDNSAPDAADDQPFEFNRSAFQFEEPHAPLEEPQLQNEYYGLDFADPLTRPFADRNSFSGKSPGDLFDDFAPHASEAYIVTEPDLIAEDRRSPHTTTSPSGVIHLGLIEEESDVLGKHHENVPESPMPKSLYVDHIPPFMRDSKASKLPAESDIQVNDKQKHDGWSSWCASENYHCAPGGTSTPRSESHLNLASGAQLPSPIVDHSPPMTSDFEYCGMMDET